jgi:hypothetical protein
MYSLILTIAMISSGGGTTVATPAMSSVILGKYGDLDACKAAAAKPFAAGSIQDLGVSTGSYWYCAYTGP